MDAIQSAHESWAVQVFFEGRWVSATKLNGTPYIYPSEDEAIAAKRVLYPGAKSGVRVKKL